MRDLVIKMLKNKGPSLDQGCTLAYNEKGVALIGDRFCGKSSILLYLCAYKQGRPINDDRSNITITITKHGETITDIKTKPNPEFSFSNVGHSELFTEIGVTGFNDSTKKALQEAGMGNNFKKISETLKQNKKEKDLNKKYGLENRINEIIEAHFKKIRFKEEKEINYLFFFSENIPLSIKKVDFNKLDGLFEHLKKIQVSRHYKLEKKILFAIIKNNVSVYIIGKNFGSVKDKAERIAKIVEKV